MLSQVSALFRSALGRIDCQRPDGPVFRSKAEHRIIADKIRRAPGDVFDMPTHVDGYNPSSGDDGFYFDFNSGHGCFGKDPH